MCLLQEVERKRTDFLPEHQKIQKMSQKKKAETATVRTQELLRKEATKKKGGEFRK